MKTAGLTACHSSLAPLVSRSLALRARAQTPEHTRRLHKATKLHQLCAWSCTLRSM